MKKKNLDKLKEIIEKRLEEVNDDANHSACGYDSGFYSGKGEAFEEVLELLEEMKK